MLASGSTLIFLACFKRDVMPPRYFVAFFFVGLATLGIALVYSSLALIFIGNIIMGVSCAHMARTYIKVVVEQCSKTMIVSIGLVITPLASLLTLAFQGVSSFVLLIGVLLVAAVLFWIPSNRASFEESAPPIEHTRPDFSVYCLQSLFAIVSVFFAAYATKGAWILTYEFQISVGGVIACPSAAAAMLAIWMVFRKKDTLAFAQASAIFVSLGLVVLALLQTEVFIGGFGSSFVQIAASIAFDIVSMLLVRQGRQSLSSLLILRSIISLLSGAIFLFIPTGFVPGAQTIVTIVLYSLMAALILLASRKAKRAAEEAELQKQRMQQEDRATSDETLHATCLHIAAEKGLTPRELEVVIMLAQGRSRPYIESELFISSGTAKTHIRHVYDKLEVHSKQDLISYVKDFESNPSLSEGK